MPGMFSGGGGQPQGGFGGFNSGNRISAPGGFGQAAVPNFDAQGGGYYNPVGPYTSEQLASWGANQAGPMASGVPGMQAGYTVGQGSGAAATPMASGVPGMQAGYTVAQGPGAAATPISSGVPGMQAGYTVAQGPGASATPIGAPYAGFTPWTPSGVGEHGQSQAMNPYQIQALMQVMQFIRSLYGG